MPNNHAISARLYAALGLLTTSLFSAPASAHGFDGNRASVRLAGDTAYVIITPPAAAFPECDDDRNGLLKTPEVRACRKQLLANIDLHFELRDQQGHAGTTVFADVSTPHAFDGTHPNGAHHLRFTLRYRWSVPPASLTVRYDYGDLHPLTLHARRMTPTRLLPQQRPLGSPERVTLDGETTHAIVLAALQNNGSTPRAADSVAPPPPFDPSRPPLPPQTTSTLAIPPQLPALLLLASLAAAVAIRRQRSKPRPSINPAAL